MSYIRPKENGFVRIYPVRTLSLGEVKIRCDNIKMGSLWAANLKAGGYDAKYVLPTQNQPGIVWVR